MFISHNSEEKSSAHNSDIFSHNSEFTSRNSDFITREIISHLLYFSREENQSCEIKSHN